MVYVKFVYKIIIIWLTPYLCDLLNLVNIIPHKNLHMVPCFHYIKDLEGYAMYEPHSNASGTSQDLPDMFSLHRLCLT